jgi:hypothetical protein
MRLMFSITLAVLQSALAQIILLVYSLYTTMDILTAVTTTVTLLFFIGIYQIILGFLLWRLAQLLKMVLIPTLSSFLTAVTLTVYPSLGFTIDFWTLFAVLFLAGILSCIMLYGAGASWSECNNG